MRRCRRGAEKTSMLTDRSRSYSKTSQSTDFLWPPNNNGPCPAILGLCSRRLIRDSGVHKVAVVTAVDLPHCPTDNLDDFWRMAIARLRLNPWVCSDASVPRA